MRKENAENALALGSRQPVAVNSDRLKDIINRVVDQRTNNHRLNVATRMQTSLNEFKERIDQRTAETANDMQRNLERFYLLGLQGGDNLMNRLGEPFNLLENAMCSLLERDQYALDYFRMKFEIIELKNKLGIHEPNFLDHLH